MNRNRPIVVGFLRGLVYAVITALASYIIAAATTLSATELGPYVPVIVVAARAVEAWVADERNSSN